MKLDKVASRLQKHYKIDFNVGKQLYDQLVSACLLPDTGARNIDSILNQQILPVVSSLLLQRNSHHPDTTQTLILDFDKSEGIVLEWAKQSNQKVKSKKAQTTKSTKVAPLKTIKNSNKPKSKIK